MRPFMEPAPPRGSTEEQLRRQWSYLYQMHQQLQLALEQIEGGSAADLPSASAGAGGTGKETKAYDALKSLVLKTAETVRAEMDQLTATLESSYVAAGQFGSYVQSLSAYLEANPEALTQYYHFVSDLRANTAAVSDAFESYRIGTEGYIRTGIVSYESGVPVYGVAVGQHLTARQVDGETVVDPTNFRATFTARRLSFWQDEAEVAYVSDNRLYISNITVLGDLTLGTWKVGTRNGGLRFQWIGG